MDGVLSNWRLTLDPAGTATVLVNYGDKLTEEIQWSAERAANLEPMVRSAAADLTDGQNVSAQLAFTRLDDAASDAASRRDLLAALVSALTPAEKPLKIEVSGITDRYWQFAAALVTTYTPGRYLPSSRSRRTTSFSLIATGLSQVGP